MSGPTVYGIALGATASVTVDATGEIFRNELGGHTTASLCGFGMEGARTLGEAAVSGLTANAKATALEVGRFALIPHAALMASPISRHWQYSTAASDDGSALMTDVEAAGGKSLSSVGLLGALLGKMRETSGASEGSMLSIAVPALPADSGAAELAQGTLADAAAIGGWSLVAAPSAADALAAALVRKWPFAKSEEGGPSRLILVVDVGASSTIAALVRLTPPGGGELQTEAQSEVVASRSDAFLGAQLFDEALFDHFAAKIEEKYGEGVAPASRRGLRLSMAIERLRKLLSTMKEASATAENLIDGIDVPLTATRDELSELCASPLARMRALFDDLLAALPAEDSAVAAVETVGGGMRMPCVQAVLSEALAACPATAALAEEKPGAKLDDASLAIGAALLATRSAAPAADAAPDADSAAKGSDEEPAGEAGSGLTAAPTPLAGRLSAEALAALVAEEKAFAASDAAAAARGKVRNDFEGFVLDSRSLSSRKHGEKVDTAALSPLLDAAEDWLYSDEAERADVTVLEAKLAELKAGVEAATAAFQSAVAADKLAEEKALEVASAAAAAERAANGEDEDHDTRKLKFPDRLRLVTKNKEEGTELFKGAVDNVQFRSACARYNKALTHAAKFVDLSPDQRAEVDALKLSLHLNIAMCWLKITDAENHLDQAIRACDEALAIDADSTKALFRRATAREQKGQYDEAKADLQRAAELAPDDKAVPKLLTRVDAQIARQKAKEKKMYGKMFG